MSFSDEVLFECSKTFHLNAGLSHYKASGPIVEVAHQPLFYPGEWFYKKFEAAWDLAREQKGTMVWGVVDDDFFLFPRMWRGESRRLSNRQVKPRRTCFWSVSKPVELTGFPLAKSLAAHNAFVIANELKSRGVKPLCFFYSNLPLLAKEFEWFKTRRLAFRNAFNESVFNHQDNAVVKGLRLIGEDEYPLWKVNADGSKSTLTIRDSFSTIGFKAVARPFAMSSFLNSKIYVCGQGAARGYELVVSDVAKALGVELPVRVVV
jgi:hypothetical protein